MKHYSQTQSLMLRIWHWLDALVVVALLLTYLLRETLLKVSANKVLFQAKLAEKQIVVSDDVARELAATLKDNLWDWHIKLGYALTALLLFRLVIFVIEGPGPFALKRYTNDLHSLLVKSSYVAFYLVQVVMVGTGLAMVFSGELGLGDKAGEFAGEVHENIMWFFVIFIVGHLVGVIRAELTDQPGIVSRMIHGGRSR